jgi:dTDP-4-dehydrorhamnose 3,5-epimerase
MPKSVEIEKTKLDGVLIITSEKHRDERGFFMETYSKDKWAKEGFNETFVQDNLSLSSKGTLRGMHFQLATHGTGKLVRAIKGSVFDVAVDLRRGSPTFKEWVGCELTDENDKALWVPVGFAHGFIALDDDTLVYYKCTAHYAPDAERALSYKDPDVNIEWPIPPVHVSDKDKKAPLLEAAEYDFVYQPPAPH